MRTDFYYDSCGAGTIHGCRWMPEGQPRAVVQIVHGIAEYVERYDGFADYLTKLGCMVVAEDHMGHGKSTTGGVQGYFHGGWFSAVEDTYHLLETTMQQYPELPYVLFGHSMGSFMVRTILAKYPNSGISAAVICGTGWQPKALLKAAIPLCALVCRMDGERNPSPKLEKLVFGSYNKRVEHPRTAYDWLTRDDRVVDAYIADPLCGFTPSAGLMRDMLSGISYIQEERSLRNMRKDLPVLFIAGGDDPVGNYGAGVQRTVEAFKAAGMQNVKLRLYPLCRHELLNEVNRQEVYKDVAQWLAPYIKDVIVASNQ